ncbi:MAG: helix-turn-helix transcriptional regulator [Candidatus Moraniibacteriota bacterium]
MEGTVINGIERLRRERGLTQEVLADAVGVTRQTVIALEKGNYVPSVLLALRIARFFGHPVEAIFKVKI